MRQLITFISSSIYEFCDLLSALKDYLEKSGVRVLAPENNDFTKPLDKHFYEARLDTIKQSPKESTYHAGPFSSVTTSIKII